MSGKRAANPKSPATSSRASKRKSHNLAEQRRAQRIRSAIDDLRGLMVEDGLDVKSEKHAVLQGAVDYIRLLRARQGPSAGEHSAPPLPELPVSLPPSMPVPGVNMVHASTRDPAAQVDWRQVFLYGGTAQAISRLDGSFLDCNAQFTKFTGFTREQILSRTMFTMIPPSELESTFKVISEVMADPSGVPKHFIKQCLFKAGVATVFASMAVVRDPQGVATHFSCSFVPIAADQELIASTASCLQPPSTECSPGKLLASLLTDGHAAGGSPEHGDGTLTNASVASSAGAGAGAGAGARPDSDDGADGDLGVEDSLGRSLAASLPPSTPTTMFASPSGPHQPSVPTPAGAGVVAPVPTSFTLPDLDAPLPSPSAAVEQSGVDDGFAVDALLSDPTLLAEFIG